MLTVTTTKGRLRLLEQLPEELLQNVLGRLDRPSLKGFALASNWAYVKAAAWIWKEVTLVDCKTEYNVWVGYDVELSNLNTNGFDPGPVTRDHGIPRPFVNMYIRNRHLDVLRRRMRALGPTVARCDEHDDTPIIKKLIVLASKPWIAASVQVLTHRCRLDPPALSMDLPHNPLSSQTLSADPRTAYLAHLACQNMSRVHTLHIIYGHPSLNDAILRSLFDKTRARITPVRKLWLENCRLAAGCESFDFSHPFNLDIPLQLDFAGLESLRLRRMPIRPGLSTSVILPADSYVAARSQIWENYSNDFGSVETTTVSNVRLEQMAHDSWIPAAEPSLMIQYGLAMQFDDKIYDKLMGSLTPEQRKIVLLRHIPEHKERCWAEFRGPYLDPLNINSAFYDVDKIEPRLRQRETSPSATVATNMIKMARGTLTSLCLDWVFTAPNVLGSSREPGAPREWFRTFARLFSLRFPQLRAFQLRNSVFPETMIPPGLFLLDRSHVKVYHEPRDIPIEQYDLTQEEKEHLDLACLEFMEAHTSLKCLAWPVKSFFHESGPSADIAPRVDAVIDALGRSLIELRVETDYDTAGKTQTQEIVCANIEARDRRRKFIALFAQKMTKIESIKIEGGFPWDEQRELLRALRACPVKKLVVTGLWCPIGNTWDEEDEDLEPASPTQTDSDWEGEDEVAVRSFALRPLDRRAAHIPPHPSYGWPAGPPQMYNIATYFAGSITSLKLCGRMGAPNLEDPSPIVEPMLYPLKHFHRLDTLVLSVQLDTSYQNQLRNRDIIEHWLSLRDPNAAPLYRPLDDEPEGWERELLTRFAPDALAWRVTSVIGRYLSDTAKQRPGGVTVRASFAMGAWGSTFDLDVRIGHAALGSKMLGFRGPREELEPSRRQEKLETRAWF